MSGDHLRLVADNTNGTVVPGPGFKPRVAAPQDFVQSFVFLEDDGELIVMHNGKEVTVLAAVDAMAAVAAYLYRRVMAAKAAAPSAPPTRVPTICGGVAPDVGGPGDGEICAEIYGDGA